MNKRDQHPEGLYYFQLLNKITKISPSYKVNKHEKVTIANKESKKLNAVENFTPYF
jgi:hypothetical protein